MTLFVGGFHSIANNVNRITYTPPDKSIKQKTEDNGNTNTNTKRSDFAALAEWQDHYTD